MDLILPLLLVLALGAPGDIYRCSDAAGKVSFQDRPCAGDHSAQLARHGEDAASSERQLQQWLDRYRRRQGAASTAQPGGGPDGQVRIPGRNSASAVSEAQLAMCSERFLECAQADAAAMDACVDQLPRCSAEGAAPCCPQACIGRYQSLRAEGEELASSVRLALLDPAAPACGSAASEY